MTKTMNKPVSRILALCLVTCMMCAFSVTAFAAVVDTSGGEGSTPVYLSSTEDGSIDGTPAATAMSVTVPTALPMSMSQSGDVTTADNCKIVNNSYGAVRVKSVTISAASDWHLTKFGDKSILAGEKVDSNKLGFSISIGGGEAVATSNEDATQQLIAASIDGCYLTGIGDTTGNTAAIEYAAIVTPLSGAVTNATVANVVFVIEWDTVA